MNQDMELLKNITLGCLRMEVQENGYIAFSRLTKKQEELYVAKGYSTRPFATASVKLEFYTKGGEVSFDYEVSPGTKRDYYSIDLLVNGVFCYHISKDTCKDNGKFVYHIPCSEVEQRVTIYFPSTACVKIRNISLPDDYMPYKRKIRILALGDSTVQGYYPNHSQNTYANIISDKYEADILNQAIGGSVFNKDFLYKLSFEPDFIIVSFGINDWALRRFQSGEESRSYFECLTSIYPKKPVFVIIPFEVYALARKNPDLVKVEGKVSEEFDSQTLEDLREKLLEIVRDYENIVPINAKNFVPRYLECFYEDKIHFSDLGNVLAAQGIIEEIEKHMSKICGY